MAESLVAILLVTTSSKGSNLVFHWPPYPSTQPRLARPKPRYEEKNALLDNVWIAATNYDASKTEDTYNPILDDWDYEWRRPNVYRDRTRSVSFVEPPGRSRPGSRRASPSKIKESSRFDANVSLGDSSFTNYEYDSLFGFPSEFLANILCPKDDMCHQKFEFIVDDLAFIGHPVCADPDGTWKFKKERGRETREGLEHNIFSENNRTTGKTHDSEIPMKPSTVSASPPHTFHLVFVIDLPDPSSSSSGNVFKYFHVIYEHLAFTVTAVLFQEQVLNRYVDGECETLVSIRDDCYTRYVSFDEYIAQALDASSLARAMKTLYEAVKANSIARLVINEIGVEVQLPPQLDKLLHAEEENPDFIERSDPDSVSWGPELKFGWGLPTLAPWKSLLLYDIDEDQNDLKMNLSRPGLSQEDQRLAEGLIQFLETVSIFDSLADIAHSLDWDLEGQVYPTVRWLVYHRRAKIVDTVHRGLRTVFALSSKINRTLPELSEEFSRSFPNPAISPLPKLFASISNPTSSPSFSPVLGPIRSHAHSRSVPQLAHAPNSVTQATIPMSSDFFTCAVRKKDLIPLYQDVVKWLLRHELIVTLHLHIRIVATAAIKERVRQRRRRAEKRRFERNQQAVAYDRGQSRRQSVGAGYNVGLNAGIGGGISGLIGPNRYINDGLTTESFASRGRERSLSRRYSNNGPAPLLEGGITRSFKYHSDFGNRGRSTLRRSAMDEIESTNEVHDADTDDETGGMRIADMDMDDENEEEDDDIVMEEDRFEDNHCSSIITEPGQATTLQRKWIAAMSDGKNEEVARRFQLINQFFNGKRTDAEILHEAEITRRQLREVLQQYDEYLLTSLHPA